MACGWALRHADGNYDSGIWLLRPNRWQNMGAAMLRLRHDLREVLTMFHVDLLAFEEVRKHMGTDAAHLYGAIVGVLTEECEQRGLPYQGMPVGTVKKHATGKGNANKAKMELAARKRWPEHKFADDNEIDARWIAEAAFVTVCT